MFFTKLFYYYFEYEFYYTVEIALKLVINISKKLLILNVWILKLMYGHAYCFLGGSSRLLLIPKSFQQHRSTIVFCISPPNYLWHFRMFKMLKKCPRRTMILKYLKSNIEVDLLFFQI